MRPSFFTSPSSGTLAFTLTLALALPAHSLPQQQQQQDAALLPDVGNAVSSAVSSLASPVSSAVSSLASPLAPQLTTPSNYNSTASNGTSNASCSYWYEQVQHRGIAAFNPDPSYKVYRNVKDFGAKGDGSSDDTDAIQNAITSGNRVSPATNLGSTTTLAVVYFPPGDYVISKPIVDYFYTQIIGNPNCLPTIRASKDFAGAFMIDGDPYNSTGQLGETATNLFFRQVKNFALDMTQGPANLTGVHWPTGQATSVQNVVFDLSPSPDTQQVGVLIESGSGGFIGDLVFHGGRTGMSLGNQQYTMRNLSFTNTQSAISYSYDWGWTLQYLHVKNSSVAINMTNGGPAAQSVSAVTLIDSTIEDTPVGVLSAHSATALPPSAGGLNLENVILKNVPSAVKAGDDESSLQGTTGSTTIAAWSSGKRYTGTTGSTASGNISPNPRAGGLLDSNGRFYTKAKPDYANVPLTGILAVRAAGAVGDGKADDTVALQKAITDAASSNKVLFVDAGTYRVTSTIEIPPNSRIVGEGYSVIMSSGPAFADMKKPTPVIRVGKVSGTPGKAELVNLVVSTQSDATEKTGQAGAVLIEWNLLSGRGAESGMWDVHTRISGFTGSNQQIADCPTTPTTNTTSANQIKPQCVTAFMSMHVTRGASGLLMENNWLWTSDHDIDYTQSPTANQITVYTGRGLLIESGPGLLWLYGTAVEHHALYQYQFCSTSAIVAGQIQTETPYWQPNPDAALAFPAVPELNDPVFQSNSSLRINSTESAPNRNAWGARFLRSTGVLVYGAGFYSFFDNYNTSCNTHGACQSRILDVQQSSLYLYDLHTVGTTEMITLDGKDAAPYDQNVAGFTSNVAAFRSSGSF